MEYYNRRGKKRKETTFSKVAKESEEKNRRRERVREREKDKLLRGTSTLVSSLLSLLSLDG